MTGYRTLSPDVEEGICQVLAHLWIESEIMAGSGSGAASSSSGSSSSMSSKKAGRSQFEHKLGDFFKHQIETDTSMAYGEGFRAGNRAVLQYGLKRTLEHIRLTGTFPFWSGMDSHFAENLILYTWFVIQCSFTAKETNCTNILSRIQRYILEGKMGIKWLRSMASLTNHFVLWPNSGTKTMVIFFLHMAWISINTSTILQYVYTVAWTCELIWNCLVRISQKKIWNCLVVCFCFLAGGSCRAEFEFLAGSGIELLWYPTGRTDPSCFEYPTVSRRIRQNSRKSHRSCRTQHVRAGTRFLASSCLALNRRRPPLRYMQIALGRIGSRVSAPTKIVIDLIVLTGATITALFSS